MKGVLFFNQTNDQGREMFVRIVECCVFVFLASVPQEKIELMARNPKTSSSIVGEQLPGNVPQRVYKF